MIRGGRNYVSSPPSFSNDAKCLLVCAGNSVFIFSISTGLLVTSLDGHRDRVTSVIVVPASGPASKVLCFCWTSSLDGTIKYWDFSLPELIKTIQIGFPIFSMVIPSLLCQEINTNENRHKQFAYIYVKDMKKAEQSDNVLQGQVKKCNLNDSRLARGIIFAETKDPGIITVSSSGRYFGISIKQTLRIWKVPTIDSERAFVKKIRLHHTKIFTVIAFHPFKRIVAAGDVTGRILIWRGFGNKTFVEGDAPVHRDSSMNTNEDRPGVREDDDADLCTTWHWHPNAVRVLSFSSDGAYLYSGGKEGVFVVWQLDTGKKKFLPRVGSPLLYYADSPDPSLSSISCADNRINLLKMPSMEILKSISGIKLPHSFSEISDSICNYIAFNHNGLVALSTENYRIQLYSLFDDRGISEVQVCERYYHPDDDATIAVSLLALSTNGSLMCTVEVRLPEASLGGLVSLKFWVSRSDKKEFSLSTVVYEPHREARISSVVFHPFCNMVASSSYGGDFKIWVCGDDIQTKDQMPPNSGWTCNAVGSYRKQPMTAAAFSQDGSVLAVAAETVVTLWDPFKNFLVAVIGETLVPIVSLMFVGESDFLVSASLGSKSQLCVWSLSKMSVFWSYMLHVEAVATMPDSSDFAVLALDLKSSKSKKRMEASFNGKDGVILLFKADDPVPTAVWMVNKAKGGAIAFISGGRPGTDGNGVDGQTASALIAYMNADHEYVLFDPLGKQVDELNLIQHRLLSLPEEGKFGYASIYGELPTLKMKREQDSWVPSVPSERPWEAIFAGSTHSLPPLTKLCSTFLEGLLEKRTTAPLTGEC